MKAHKFIISLLLMMLFLTFSACTSSAEPLPTLAPQAHVPGTDPTPTSPSTNPQRTVTTDDGTFDIPGIGYMDGRDLEANPPLTIMEIRVWDGVGRIRHEICKLQHGAQVEILDVKQDPDVDYTWYNFQIQSNSCKGWVTWWFVNTEKYAPAGERIYDN